MRVPTMFSRVCLVWLFYSQALLILLLWYYYDVGVGETLFGSPLLGRISALLAGIAAVGVITLLTLGGLLALVYAVKERGLGLNTAWALSGIAYVAVVPIGALLLMASSVRWYCPPPEVWEFFGVFNLIALDIISLIFIRRFIRRHCARVSDTLPREATG